MGALTRKVIVILAVYLFVSYLIGSVPSGILLARAAGLKDPRSTNLTPLSGTKIGAFTFVLDFLKGFVPVLFAYLYWPEDSFATSLGALFAVLGHCYSVFLLFKGGKGVATTAGALLPLAPFPMLIALAAWGLAYYAFRLTSLAAMCAVLVLLCALLLCGAPPPVLAVAGICCVMVVRRHQANLEDLLGGKERSF